jgi:hypothetical protein
MQKEQLKRIFEFLEEKENKLAKVKGTLRWKIEFNEPLTKEDLDIKGGLFLEHSDIPYLPEGLKIGGNLNLSYTPKLKSLPSDLYVRRDIYLEGSNITSLPEDLQVGRDLDLSDTQVELLPKGLQVGGTLDLRRTKITLLPKGLEVKGELIIKNTALLEYIDKELRDMIKPGFIKGEIIR